MQETEWSSNPVWELRPGYINVKNVRILYIFCLKLTYDGEVFCRSPNVSTPNHSTHFAEIYYCRGLPPTFLDFVWMKHEHESGELLHARLVVVSSLLTGYGILLCWSSWNHASKREEEKCRRGTHLGRIFLEEF